MLGIEKFSEIRKITLPEWASILFAGGALIVSILSYNLSVDTYKISVEASAALKENIDIKCDLVDAKLGKTYRYTEQTKKNELLGYVTGQWIVHLYNNSMNDVTIRYVEHDVNTIDGTISTLSIKSDKHEAVHAETDKDIYIDKNKSTTVFITQDIPLAKEAIFTDGVLEAKSIDAANDLLKAKHINIFGRRIVTNENGYLSYSKDGFVFDWINIRATTSSGKVFPGKCSTYNDFGLN